MVVCGKKIALDLRYWINYLFMDNINIHTAGMAGTYRINARNNFSTKIVIYSLQINK